MRQEEVAKLRQQKEENMKKMTKWKQENDKNMAVKEELKKRELEKDQEMIIKARQVADDAERKRLKELEVLKAKMKVLVKFHLNDLLAHSVLISTVMINNSPMVKM